MNRVKLLFFATLRDRAGTKSMELDIPADLTVQGLKDKISAEYPNLEGFDVQCADHHQSRICL